MISVSEDLKDVLDSRIDAIKSPGSNLAWTTSKVPWMKFTSNVIHKPVTIADGIVAFHQPLSVFQTISGGATSINDLYDMGSRSVPMPGLISATIKHTGTLKTLKKVEVTYKCYHIDHLQELEMLFMSLGKTVVLEYGWSIKPDGTPVTRMLSEDDYILGFSEFVAKSSKLSLQNLGCSGADKGVVSHFSWTQDSDGSYTCTTSFITPAEMMMENDSTTVDKTTGCCKTHKSDAEKSCDKESDATIKLKHLLDNSSVTTMKYNQWAEVMDVDSTIEKYRGTNAFKNQIGNRAHPIGFHMEMDKVQTPEERADRDWGDTGKRFADSIMTPVKYVTWAYFEESIINDALKFKNHGADTSDNGGHSWDQAPGSYRIPGLNATERLDSRMTLLHNPNGMTSSDPTICLLRGQEFWHSISTGNVFIKDFKGMAGLKYMPDFATHDSILLDHGKNLGWLAHILINIRFLIKCGEESKTVSELISKVLSGINEACGDHWDLSVVPMPGHPELTTIIDTKSLGKLITPYSLSIQGNHTICKEVTLNTEVSNEVKAQVAYGNNRSKPDPSADPTGPIFDTETIDRTPKWGQQYKETKQLCHNDVDQESGGGTEIQRLQAQYRQARDRLLEGVDSEGVSTMKATIKALQLYSPSPDKSAPLIPINFSFKMEGIVGFEWGHSLIMDPILPKYTDCAFMVTGIDHDISTDSWDTSISTILRVPPITNTSTVDAFSPVAEYRTAVQKEQMRKAQEKIPYAKTGAF